jgi:hypothetical protein
LASHGGELEISLNILWDCISGKYCKCGNSVKRSSEKVSNDGSLKTVEIIPKKGSDYKRRKLDQATTGLF